MNPCPGPTRNRDPVAYGSLFLPYELMHGLGLVPFLPEVLAGFTAGMGIAPSTLKKANSQWYSPDLCTFHRSASGAIELGLFPKPQFIICTNLACDAAQKSFYTYAHKFKMEEDYYLIDVPYNYSEESIDYLSRQLEQMSKKITSRLGKKVDMDALAQAIENSNDFRYWAQKVNQVRKKLNTYPPDFNGLNFILPFHGMAGTRQAVSLYKKMYRELSSLAQEAGSARPRKRLLWLHLKPYYRNEIFSLLEQGNCMVAFEEINHVYWPKLDPAQPFRSMAIKMLSHYLRGSINNRLKVISKLTEDYRMDGVILFSHWGCRQNNAAARLIKDQVRKAGLPTLVIDGDCVDQNNYSHGQLQTRIQGFTELLG
ncbi:MAG: 2-hydroxyacyl-CoA dehydratase family protein [Actinomycetota bacterium]|nr:2-hydroxyacyl-CoA dehydratase family protein [Actinomycetota bacterium]